MASGSLHLASKCIAKARSLQRAVTCGVERDFGTLRTLFKRRELTNVNAVATVLKLQKKRTTENENAIISRAQELFIEHYCHHVSP